MTTEEGEGGEDRLGEQRAERRQGDEREADHWEETTVVCADHGELHDEHGLYGHEFAFYEELINVPLLIKNPSLETDRREDRVELLDCYHTVLDVLNVDPDAAIETSEDSIAEFDQTRSLVLDVCCAFEGIAEPDPGQRAVLDAVGGDNSDDAVVEYAQPVIELHHLEEKASDSGIDLPDDHRAYSRLRAARGTDAKYVRADRIPDEAYRIDEDPEEESPVDPADDDAVTAAERALARFEETVGDAWDDPSEAAHDDADALADADEETGERLRELGYLE